VIIFMTLIYGVLGLMANVALVLNLVLLTALLSALGATLTLPGIAGIVLTMGMAVDANVLIYERIREEHRLGRGIIGSVQAGFERAFGTILDANLTTLAAAALLFQFGSGPIKGFAVTLTLGLISSMFTAIMVTRLMVSLWIKWHRPKTLPL
jgi:preprotein translocase subunit SecD